ncbi:flagellar hook-basal body complex protein [Proteinivorax hydrogeniformans]|uniref:Flagellar hook-basal body complex protein n=1 Tax=Proteinivorax hydrogeniformans TaxID=1826727 RepID=A0AAU8HTP4_9FIRM
MRSLWIGGSGLLTQQKNIDIIGNNVSNVNTNGYKKNRTSFEDILYANTQQNQQPVDEEIRQTPQGIQIGNGVIVSGTKQIFSQGAINNTGKTWDLAIEGPGFFGVEVDGVTHLTREGNFSVDSNGDLVNSSGFEVAGEFQQNLNDVSNISINAAGEVFGTPDGQEESVQIGTVFTYNVNNPEGLLSMGDNLLLATENSGQQELYQSNIKQGALEGSNVDLAEEMTNMITAQRSYQTSARVLHTADEMMSQANNIKR